MALRLELTLSSFKASSAWTSNGCLLSVLSADRKPRFAAIETSLHYLNTWEKSTLRLLNLRLHPQYFLEKQLHLFFFLRAFSYFFFQH